MEILEIIQMTMVEKYQRILEYQPQTMSLSFLYCFTTSKGEKWLGPTLLISSLIEKFDIEYTIKSKHSDGNL